MFVRIQLALGIFLMNTTMASAAELQEVASFPDKQLTGVGVSTKSARIFVNFPCWSDDHSISVAEMVNGQPKAFPNDEWNKAGPVGSHFICVQSVVVNDQDNLWVLIISPAGLNAALISSFLNVRMAPDLCGFLFVNEMQTTI